MENEKYVFRAESAQEILRPYYKPLNLFMGFLLLTFDLERSDLTQLAVPLLRL